MKKYLFFAAAALALASCSEQVDFTQESLQTQNEGPTAVQFGTYLGSQNMTRATQDQTYTTGPIGNTDDNVNGVTNLTKAQFGVFGYYTGAKDYREAYNSWGTSTWKTDNATKYPNFMYNEHLMWSTSEPTNMWIYSQVKYWPNGNDKATTSTNATNPSGTAEQNAVAKVSFFAYAPYMQEGSTATTGSDIPTSVTANDVNSPKTIDHDGNASTAEVNNGIVAISNNTSPTDVWVKYVMPVAKEDKAVDLLWGIRGKKIYQETDGSNNTVTNLTDDVYNTDLTKQVTSERVTFLFKHALTKIGGVTATSTESVDGEPSSCGFKVVVDIDKNSETPKTGGQSNQTAYFASNFNNATTLVTLKSVKIRDLTTVVADNDVTEITSGTSNLLKSGWFDIESGTWYTTNAEEGATYKVVAENTAAADANLNDETYSLNVKIKEIGAKKNGVSGTGKEMESGDASWDTSANPVGVTTTPTDVFANENVPGLLLIPGGSQDLYITVTYVVRTADPKLAAGFSEVEQTITNKVTLSSLSPNKYYTIIMHLGLTSVKFAATVTNWATNDANEYNDDGAVVDPSSPTANEEVIWLPSNVVK